MTNTTSKRTTIDYDEVARSYEESLTSTLRGFRPASVFLETWVHDEDTVNSVVNMAEAAEGAGLHEVVIRLGAQTAKALTAEDRAALVRRGERLGRIAIAAREDGIEGADVHVVFEAVRRIDAAESGQNRGQNEQPHAPHVRDARDVDAFERPPVEAAATTTNDASTEIAEHAPASAPPLRRSNPPPRALDARYLAALEAYAPADREGRLEMMYHLVLVEAAEGGVTLGVLVDPKTHVVRAARHSGGSGETSRRLLGALCMLLEERPLHEGSDHAVVRLEHLLRDRTQSRVVSGIVLPQNADPAFAPLVRLSRDLHTRYAALARVARAPNEFEPRPTERWLAKSDVDQIAAIQAAIDAAAPTFDLAPGDVVCDRIEHGMKVTVALTREIPPALKARILMRLEHAVKTSVERALSFYLDEMRDKNKLRRLVLKPDLRTDLKKRPTEGSVDEQEVKA